MILRGCVRGAIYPVQERVYEEPLDGTRTCKWCHRKFMPTGSGKHTYCRDECRKNGLKDSQNRASRKYYRKKVKA